MSAPFLIVALVASSPTKGGWSAGTGSVYRTSSARNSANWSRFRVK
ncbi:hypothetical protein O1L60_37020 [Streptomyces diastatochromogenes]|nr:hypothetical protein [Streptomyces diastatochromogenes]